MNLFGGKMTNSKNKSMFSLSLLGACALFALPNQAQAIELEQISARAGTLGLGAEIGFEIVPTIVVRGIGQKYDYSYNKTVDGIQYNGNLGMQSFGAQVDFHPPLIPLYLTAGIYNNGNKIDLTASPTGSYNIGGTNYTGAQVGTLTSKAEFDPTALYGGLGLEFQLGPVAMVAEGGVYYQGKPRINMNVTGPIASDPTFQTNLANEKAQVQEELDKAKYWPAITVMGRWKF